MSVASSRVKITAAMRDLRIAWDQATSQWNDPAAHAFEKTRIEPVEHRIKSVLTAMDSMRETLASARRECGDGAG